MDESEKNTFTENETKLMLVAAPAKRRGVNPGTKRGPYNKNNPVEDAVIEEDIHFKKLEEFTNESEYEEVIQEQAPPPPPPEREEPKEERKGSEPFKPKYNTHLFNGLFLLKIFNFIFPALLKGVLILFGIKKAKKLKIANLKLEADEQEDFEDIADEAAPYIFGKIHPMILGVTMFGYSYARKAMSELDAIPDEEEEQD